MSRRVERLQSIIRHELMEVIQRELSDPRITGLPSITRVKVSEDLSTAEVFVTIMGTPAEQRNSLNALRHSAGLMRTRLTKALTIRQVPFLTIQMDEKLKKELEVLSLLDKVAQENAELDARRAAAAGEPPLAGNETPPAGNELPPAGDEPPAADPGPKP